MSEIKLEVEFSEMVRKLAKPGADIRNELTAMQANFLHMAVGISGEAGEILDTIKKHCIYQKPLDYENIVEELGDLEFFMEGMRQCVGYNRDFILQKNIEKLSKRYPKGYTNKSAQERLDKI